MGIGCARGMVNIHRQRRIASLRIVIVNKSSVRRARSGRLMPDLLTTTYEARRRVLRTEYSYNSRTGLVSNVCGSTLGF